MPPGPPGSGSSVAGWLVRPANLGDTVAMQQVAAAAGRRFAEIADPRIAACAADPPPTQEALAAWVRDGRAWVAVHGDAVAGFLVADVLDGSLHVEEVDVVPAASGRGLGTALLEAAAEAARRQGHPAVTLTTFRDVPWNRPWYERRGFAVLAAAEIGPELAERMREEAAHGLEPGLRVAMRRPVAR